MYRFFFLISCLLCTASAAAIDSKGYVDPNSFDGGSMLTGVYNTEPFGQGEPMNVIISANSDPEILTEAGLKLWLNSLNFSQNCLGQATGIGGGDTKQNATLDPGLTLNQTFVFREDWGNHLYGACKETFNGGSRVKAFNQTSTGAIFMAAAVEEGLPYHEISGKYDGSKNGYDYGRDKLLQAAGVKGMDGPTAGNGSWISLPGTEEYSRTVSYWTEVEIVSGMLIPDDPKINHNLKIDGDVAVLTVSIIYDSLSPSVRLFTSRLSLLLPVLAWALL